MVTSSISGNSTLANSNISHGERNLPFSACFGWGVGSIATMTVLNVTNGLVLKYFVDHLAIAAYFAGLLIAGTRLFDAFIDVFVGMMSDKTSSRWGRRRPYLLAGSFLIALSPIILFAVPLWVPPAYTTIMVLFGLAIHAISYTIFNVPYMAMPVEMTQSHHERTYLFTFRIYGTAIGTLLGGALAPWIITYFGEDAQAFAKMSYVVGGLVLIAGLVAFWTTRNAPIFEPMKNTSKEKKSKVNLLNLRKVGSNRPFLFLLIAKIFIVASTGVGAAAKAFLVTDILLQPLSWLGIYALAATAGMFASQPFWLRVSRAYNKRVCFFVATSLLIVVTMTWLLAGPEETKFILALRGLFLGLSGGGVLLASQAMLPDVLEHDFKLNGIRHEGAMTGLYTTIERGASALGVALAGVVLSVGGYVGGMDASPDAIRSIYVCVAIIPCLGLFLSILAITQYRLKG